MDEMSDDLGIAGYTHMHQARVFRGIRRAEGRVSEAGSPLDHIFERRYQTVMAGEKNVANTRLLNLLADNPDERLYKIYGPKDKLPVSGRGKSERMTIGEARRRDDFVEVVVNGQSFLIQFANPAVAVAVNKHNIMKVGDGYVGKVFNMIRGLGRSCQLHSPATHQTSLLPTSPETCSLVWLR